MADRTVQLAMRRLRAHFADPRVAGGLLVVAVLTGIVGPFGTFAVLETLPRLLYWVGIVVATYAIGFFVSVALDGPLARSVPNLPLRILAIAAVQGPAIALVVHLINVLAFGASAFELPPLMVYCTLVALGISALYEIVTTAGRRQAAPGPARPPILDRLPVQQRGALRALIVSDHYVEVVTDRGEGLLLMRLSDAIRETGDVAGVQIHRSHWVALAAVERVVREGGKPVVELQGGRRLPVSRGYAAAARAAGLLV